MRETPQRPRIPSDHWRCVCLSFCSPTPLDPRGKALGQHKGSRCPVSVATGECAPWQPPTQPDLSVPVALATVVMSSLLLLHTHPEKDWGGGTTGYAGGGGLGGGWEVGEGGQESFLVLEGGKWSEPCRAILFALLPSSSRTNPWYLKS